MENFERIGRKFFERSPDDMAKDLLGKFLFRKIGNTLLVGKVVEVEAYFGEEDVASRAYKRKSEKFYIKLSSRPGNSLVYMVHNNWLFNAISHEKEEAGAVLIRAVEPISGIELMKVNRGFSKNKIEDLCNGPGKLTKAFAITKEHDGIDLVNSREIGFFYGDEERFDIASSKRIGVSRDLEEDFRFFVNGNKFVSRK